MNNGFSFIPLTPFSIENNQNNLDQGWKHWIDKFENLIIAMDITTKDKNKDAIRKRALLVHYVGDETNEILKTLPNNGTDFDTAKTALNKYFSSQRNIEFENYQFRQLKQQDNETLDQFMTKLKRAASTCDFQNEERELKSQLTLGTKSNKLRRHALRTPNLTLNEMIMYGRADETAEIHASAIEQIAEGVHTMEVRKHKQGFQNGKDQKNKQTYQRKQTYKQMNHWHKETKKQCQFCGEEWHIDGLKSCKAQGKTCYYCNKPNHLAKVCKQKNKTTNTRVYDQNKTKKQFETAHQIDQEESSDKEEYVLVNVTQGKICNNKYETINLNIEGTQTKLIIDTGATLNILNEKDFNNINPKANLVKPTVQTFAFGSKTPLNIIGTIKVKTKHRNETYWLTFHVTKENGPSLIGKDTALKLKLIKFLHQVSNQDEGKHMQEIIMEYQDLFKGLGKHKSTTINLHIDKNIKPVIQRHRRIPFHIREKVEKEIQELLKDDIIERVPNTEATEWLSPIVVRPKKNNSQEIRICVDMKTANKAIKREHHITPTIDDVLYNLNEAQYFTKLDLNKGYHQFMLDETSRSITTFSTHIGIFRYKRLSFGINSAAEIFQHELTKTLQGIPGSMNISDDVLIFGKTMKEHNKALRETMERLRNAGLTLNKTKCDFNKTKLKFLGHIFSDQGIHPDPEKIKAIQKAESPKDQTEVRSFLGLVNFCTKFTPDLASVTQPLRALIKKSSKWEWGKIQQEAFNEIKGKIATTTKLAYFDKGKETEIWVDASPIGLGAVLIQKTQDGKANSIAFASHSLNATEMKYSHIEKEALAITWAVKHFHLYVYGHTFKVMTDHQPLVSIFNKPNQQLSTRLERWRFKLQQYSFEVYYKPGKNNPADYMSRHPVTTPNTSKASESIAENYVNFIISNTIPKTMTIKEVMEHNKKDTILKQIIKNIQTNSWDQTANNNKEEAQIKAFKKIRMELSTDKTGNFLLRGSRLVIPASLRDRVIEIAHSSHQGMNRTKEILRQKVWFPGINKKVEQAIRKCRKCQAATDHHQQPELQPSEIPRGSWSSLNIDHKGPLPTGEYLLVIMDQYSKFPIVEITSSTLAKQNIQILNKIFATFGIPQTIHTDNGAPFNSKEFLQFTSNLGITHRRITPRWPRANGTIERFNKTINKILRIAYEFKQDWKNEMYNLLRDYRTTPHSITQVTPAELMFNYDYNNKLPDAKHITKSPDPDNMKERMMNQKQQMKQYFDTHNKIIKQDPKPGDWVMIRQGKGSKLHTPFDPKPYKVKQVKGSMITAERDGQEITRNVSFYKIVPPNGELEKTPCTTEMEENIEQHTKEDTTKRKEPQEREEKQNRQQEKVQMERKGRLKEEDKEEREEQTLEGKNRVAPEKEKENHNPKRIRKPPARLICEN